MEPKIQFDQECAIIPLVQFNQMKANEQIFYDKVNNKENFFGFEAEQRFYTKGTRVWFVPNEWELKRELEDSYKRDIDYQLEQIGILQKKQSNIELENLTLRREIDSLRKKRWYQFIPFNPFTR